MSKKIQLLTFQEYARKYDIRNPYDNEFYDYHTAWQNNAEPDSKGKWPKQYRRGGYVRRK